jgi:hypothetical protein
VASALATLTVVGSIAAGYRLLGGSDPTAVARPLPLGAVCPIGSTPDQPGPAEQARPPSTTFWGAFDRQSGRLIVQAAAFWPRSEWTHDPESDTWSWVTNGDFRPGGIWAFDVCTNTWEEMPSAGGPPQPHPLVYDAGSDRIIAIDQNSVWTYDSDTGTWTETAPPPEIPRGVAEYDPIADLVVLIADESTWTYDVDRDTWTEKTGANLGDHRLRSLLMVHDPTIAAMVVWVEGPELATWTYDVAADRWTHLDIQTEGVNTGYGVTGGLFAHHKGSGLSAMYSASQYAIFDAEAGRWQHRGFPVEAPVDDGPVELVVYDPINDRILVVGDPSDGVRAHNPATGEWTCLLAPSADFGAEKCAERDGGEKEGE